MDDLIVYKGTVLFGGWRESHNGEPRVVFKVPSPAPFRDLTAAKSGKAGQRLSIVAVPVGGRGPTISSEAIFAGWSGSDRSGYRIVLIVEDIESWKILTSGDELALVCVELGDDEQPVDQSRKGGLLAQLSGMLSKSKEFQDWLMKTHPHVWAQAGRVSTTPDSVAAESVRIICGVESRAELDHDPRAAAVFHNVIRLPFVDAHERD